MRSDLQEMLEAQAAWQRSRAALSWPEKIRIAEAMREIARQLRKPDAREEEGKKAMGARLNS